MGTLLFRNMTIEEVRKLSKDKDGKGPVASYLKRYLPKAKRILEKEYGIRLEKGPKIFVSMPLIIHDNRKQMCKSMLRNLARLPDFSYNALQPGAVYYHEIGAIGISPIMNFMWKFASSNNREFNAWMKKTLLHEITHGAISLTSSSIEQIRDPPERWMERMIVEEGLCEYSMKFMPSKHRKSEGISEKIKRFIFYTVQSAISWQDSLKKIYLKIISKERREVLICSKPYRWVTLRMIYLLGLRFVSELAERFDDNKKLFRYVVNMTPPKMEEILHPEVYRILSHKYAKK